MVPTAPARWGWCTEPMPWNSNDVRDCSRGCGLRTRAAGIMRHERACLVPWTMERLVEISRADISDPFACWVWAGPQAGAKYPDRQRSTRPYVAAYEITHQVYLIPRMPGREAWDVMHNCDNPPCFNPRHLVWATHQVNSADMSMKDRWGNQYRRRMK